MPRVNHYPAKGLRMEASVSRHRQPFLQQPNVSSRKLIALIKSAYWIALLIIAAITMASFILLQQMMAAQQRDDTLLTLASAQKALSQRVVFLANTIGDAPRENQLGLVASLRKAVGEFEANYDMLLERTDADALSTAPFDPKSIEGVLFSKPYHLDVFSTELAANGWRFISALETELGVPGADYRAGKETAVLDETVANTRWKSAHGDISARRRPPRQHAFPAPDAFLFDHRRHHPRRPVHLPADVGRHPAQDRRADGRAQLDGLSRGPRRTDRTA